MTPGEMKDWMAIIAPPIGWLLLFVGWTLVAKDNNHREQRKETRAQLDALVKRVRELEENGHAYYRLDADSEAGAAARLAVEIKTGMKDLRSAMKRLRLSDICTKAIDVLFRAFREQLTGGNFESKPRTKITDADTTKALLISSAARELVDFAENEYFNKYNTYASKWWAFWRR